MKIYNFLPTEYFLEKALLSLVSPFPSRGMARQSHPEAVYPGLIRDKGAFLFSKRPAEAKKVLR